MNEIKFRGVPLKITFGKTTLILIDVDDENELEALHVAPYKGQSLEWSVNLPELIRD